MKKSTFIALTHYLLLVLLIVSCKKEDDLDPDTDTKVNHESVLYDNSGWSTIAYDSEIFYPPGGFAGYQYISLLHPFVYNGQPWAIAEYGVQSSNGTSKGMATVQNGQVDRYPIAGFNFGDILKDEGNLYIFDVDDEEDVFLRRINAPDYSSYNRIQWRSTSIKYTMKKSIDSTEYVQINSTGLPGFATIDNKPYAILPHLINLRKEGEAYVKQFLCMTRTDISTGNGWVEEAMALPYNEVIQNTSSSLNMQSKALDGKVLTLVKSNEEDQVLFAFGSFETGFDYVKQLDGYRTISLFKGVSNFFCVLEKNGGSQKYGYKIDLNGNVTELGEVTGSSEYGYTHYQGDLVGAINDGTSGETSIKKFTANGTETLGISPLTKNTAIEVLMSDGNNLFGAAVNRVSPVYMGTTHQFRGWEFFKYDN